VPVKRPIRKPSISEQIVKPKPSIEKVIKKPDVVAQPKPKIPQELIKKEEPVVYNEDLQVYKEPYSCVSSVLDFELNVINVLIFCYLAARRHSSACA
jgi:hypothetical protein